MMRYIRIAIAKIRNKPLPDEGHDITPADFSSFDPNSPVPPRASRKPLIIFLLAVFGLPYLMGKLIRAMANPKPQISRPFDPSSAQFYRAVFDYIPRNPAAEMPLRKGDIVAVIQRMEGGWWRARAQDGREGFVPAGYLEGVHHPGRNAQSAPIVSPPGEAGHAFIEEFKGE
jgi:peroxin-13